MSCVQEYERVQNIVALAQSLGADANKILDLCDEYVTDGRLLNSEKSYEKAEALVAGGFLREETLLNAITQDFDEWNRPETVISICKKVKEAIEVYTFDYTISVEREMFCGKCFEFFVWMLDGIRYTLTHLEPVILPLQESLQMLLETIFEFSKKQIYSLMIYFYVNRVNTNIDQSVIVRQATFLAENAENYVKFGLNAETINSIKKLPDLVQSLLEGPRATSPHIDKNVVPETKPGVLTLGSIYACFKMNDTDFYVAEAILVFSHTIGVGRAEMICDLLRIGPLIQLKDSDAGRIAMADVFMFLRIPNILKVMVTKLNVSKVKLFEGLKKFVSHKSLLNEADITNKCNYMEHLCSVLVETELITDEMADELVKKRRAIIDKNDELGELLESTEMTQHSKIRQVRKAEQIATILYNSLDNDNKFLMLVDKLLIKCDGTPERVFSVMCANGDLDGFVETVIKINKKTETAGPNTPTLRNSRMNAFDVSFMILVKLKYMFNDLRMHESDDFCKFQEWWSLYEACLLKKTPMPVDPEHKESCGVHYEYVKNSKTFWTETSNMSTAIDSIPGIGDLMVDECRRAFLKSATDIEKVLIPFTELPCLLVCLIQWLETKHASTDHVHELAKYVDIFLTSLKANVSCTDQVAFAIYLIDYGLKHLVKKRLKEPRYTWLVTSARRTLPSLKHFEVPDEQIMKEAYIYANEQAWASPDVIKLVTNANFKAWVHCWIRQILKTKTEDEVFSAVKLFLATGFIRGTSTLSEMSQQLVELMMLPTESPVTNLNCCRPLTWLLIRLLILQIYTEQVRRRQEVLRRQRAARKDGVEGDEASNKELFNPPIKKLEDVDDMVKALNLKIEGELDEALKEQIVKKYEFVHETQKEFERMQSIHIFDEDKPGIPDLDLDEEPYPAGEFWPLPKIVHRFNRELVRNFEEVNSQATITSTTIFVALKKFEKQVKVPVLRPPVTFAVYLLDELAAVPRSRFYYKFLMTYLWPEFFIYVTRVEPFGLSINEMLKLYDIRDPEQLEHLMYFACLKRRLGAA